MRILIVEDDPLLADGLAQLLRGARFTADFRLRRYDGEYRWFRDHGCPRFASDDQFLGHIVRGENIKLVDGGSQKRAFTYIDDGINALVKIIENKDGVANGQIYNIVHASDSPANAEKEIALWFAE